MNCCRHILESLVKRQDLNQEQTQELMTMLLNKDISNEQAAAALALLSSKKETPLEISSAAQVVMSKAEAISKSNYLCADIVGTGGDGYNTINVSTISSILASSLGVYMAKHGNVSVSSKCGSADVLKELGINIDLPSHMAKKQLEQKRWCFLFAPLYHKSFKIIKPIREQLRIKTIFNILGPLVNPLDPPIMLIGVYDPALLTTFAHALKDMGKKRALIVHGSGLDEIALHDKTSCVLLDNHNISHITITTKDLGLKSFAIDQVTGGDTKDNAKLLIDILKGRGDEAKTSMVAASTGALLWLYGQEPTIHGATKIAYEALRDGVAYSTLMNLRG